MENDKQPYSIIVKTSSRDYARNYSSLDEVWKVIDSVKMGHGALLPIADNPIVIVNVKDIEDITITGVSADELLKYRQDKQIAEAQEKQRAYLNQAQAGQCESLGLASGALIGGYRQGII